MLARVLLNASGGWYGAIALLVVSLALGGCEEGDQTLQLVGSVERTAKRSGFRLVIMCAK